MNRKESQTLWAKTLVRALTQGGVNNFVISPGSRNTPLVAAALNHPGAKCHSVVDERSAGFFALGQAKKSGCASVLICTSGSAGAHYLPAVLEAGYSNTPLIVITADRPLALDQCGAPQTVDQTQFFGRNVRAFFELGDPDSNEASLRALARKAVQAHEFSHYPSPGPVHLNFRAYKPLEPATNVDVDIPIPASVRQPIVGPHPEDLKELLDQCKKSERGLIVAGPAPLDASTYAEDVFKFASLSGFPVFAEATSQLRFSSSSECQYFVADALDVFLRDAETRQNYRPDLIIQIGRAPISKAYSNLVNGDLNCPHYIVAPHTWPDPDARVHRIIRADVHEVFAQINDHLPPQEASKWSTHTRRLNELARTKVQATLNEDKFGEGTVTQAVLEQVPNATCLYVANGLPVRHVDTFGKASSKTLNIMSQRGASGIDGQISGALGAASISTSAVTLLIGDVGFLHDVSALASAQQIKTPTVIVIINNGGGRIFDQLPAASAPLCRDQFDFWTTPHQFDLRQISTAFGVTHLKVETADQLKSALANAYAEPQVTVVEALVPANSFKEQAEAIWGADE